MRKKTLRFFLLIWVLHSLAVFGFYQYHHLRKWLITPKSVSWVKEKIVR